METTSGARRLRPKSCLCLALSFLISTGFLSNSSLAQEPQDDLGLEVIQETLPWFDQRPLYPVLDLGEDDNKNPQGIAAVTTGEPKPVDGLDLLLTRSQYPAEDGHIDAVLWIGSSEATPPGTLTIRIDNMEDEPLAEHEINPIPGTQLYFSPSFRGLLDQGEAKLVVEWSDGGEIVAQVEETFQVVPALNLPNTGSIRITIPNEVEATAKGIPVTTGVPFPLGVLHEESNLRLLDSSGREVPLQTEITSRWSRFGSIRWVLCRFTVALDGGPAEFTLEFGPDIERAQMESVELELEGHGIPEIPTGIFALGEAVEADPYGEDDHRPFLQKESLLGAFVEHAHDRVYNQRRVGRGLQLGVPHRVPEEAEYRIESHGPVQTTVRYEGWFLHEETQEPFCQFDIRQTFHKESPLIKTEFTWIYTGDGNRDPISNMGWKFSLPEGFTPLGFLDSFENSEWLKSDSLLQHLDDHFDLLNNGRTDSEHQGRSPGVAAAQTEDLRIYLGIRDFWQNFPNELEFTEEGLIFHTWPRHGKPHRHPVQIEDAYRLWFAHEGEVLDFTLPMDMTTGRFYEDHSRGEPHYAYARPESVNAQGIAKTVEFWLYATDTETPETEALKVLEGLQSDAFRAVVDPAWITASGVFYEIHPLDPDQFPEHEEIYRLHTLSPMVQSDHMQVYGKWIYGEVLRDADLDARTIDGTYRIFRKGHWGWPYSWVPFARSGDPETLQFARAATRMMTDVAFVHYVSEDVATHFDELPPRWMWHPYQPFRAIGWHNRNLIPWAGYWGPTTRLYADGGEYLWHAYYLTGDHRARRVLEVWAEVTKEEHPEQFGRQALTAAQNRARWPIHLQKQYLEYYQGTFDPWFIVAAHAIADMHNYRHETEGWLGHPWNTGPHDFHRYTKNQEHLDFFEASIRNTADWRNLGWASTSSTLIPSTVHAWRLTGDDTYLRRAAGLLDLARISTFVDEEPAHYLGFNARGTLNREMLFNSWYHRWAPMLLAAMAEAGEIPGNPIFMTFTYRLQPDDVIAVLKEENQEVPLFIGGKYQITTANGEEMISAEADAPPGPGEFYSTAAVLDDEPQAELPRLKAEWPAGVYLVHLEDRSVTLPITPPDTPELLMVKDGQVGPATGTVQYWFFVPEGTDSFTITFDNAPLARQATRRLAIWGPDGALQWDLHQVGARDEFEGTIEATLEVAPEQAGRLWRVTMPAAFRGLEFTLDSQLPSALAHDPARWFDSDNVP